MENNKPKKKGKGKKKSSKSPSKQKALLSDVLPSDQYEKHLDEKIESFEVSCLKLRKN